MDKGIMEKLQAPFPPEDIEWRVGASNKENTMGLALAYVTNRAIQNRLDSIFGPFGWKNEFRPWREKGQLCGISIWDENKEQWVTKWDGADNTDFEPTKGGLSDSMKRAAYQWGIGRYLYKLEATWIPVKRQGKSLVLAQTPKLPVWALPADYKPSKEQQIQVNSQQEQENLFSEEQQQSIKHQNANFTSNELDFGKHKGKTVREVLEVDKQYVKWLAENAKDNNIKAEARQLIRAS